MSKKTLRVGDTVMWRGNFGSAPAIPAKVTDMERSHRPRDKYGQSVDEADWADKDYIVVSLDNGHWAYGEQISPCE